MSAVLDTLFGLAMIATACEICFVLGRRVDEWMSDPRPAMRGDARFFFWPIFGAFCGGGAIGSVALLVIGAHHFGAWVLAALGASR